MGTTIIGGLVGMLMFIMLYIVTNLMTTRNISIHDIFHPLVIISFFCSFFIGSVIGFLFRLLSADKKSLIDSVTPHIVKWSLFLGLFASSVGGYIGYTMRPMEPVNTFISSYISLLSGMITGFFIALVNAVEDIQDTSMRLHKERQKKDNSCYIVTATLNSGSKDTIINILRDWRNHTLRNYFIGRQMLKLYESIGPIVADYVGKNKTLSRILFILLIKPSIFVVKKRRTMKNFRLLFDIILYAFFTIGLVFGCFMYLAIITCNYIKKPLI